MDGSGYNPMPPGSGHPAEAERSAWRFFPVGVALTLLVVAIVNGVMIYYAESTFPGEAIHNEFALANRYGQVLAAEKAQRALGWHVGVSLDGRVPLLHITGRDGAPLADLVVRGFAERPLGPQHRTSLQFNQTAPGTYRADTMLDQPGNWTLVVLARGAGSTVHEVFHLLLP